LARLSSRRYPSFATRYAGTSAIWKRKYGHAGINSSNISCCLPLKGLPEGKRPTIKTLAERMQLNHNTMVELVDRCEEGDLLRRVREDRDRLVILAPLRRESA